jgi:uncharacterized membrane protein YozB (DUF420 family)
MGFACAAVAIFGFSATFWVPAMHGAFAKAPVVALHGLLFTSWVALFTYQSWLASGGKTAKHRELGLLGVALASAMVVMGFVTAIHAGMGAIGTPVYPVVRNFLIVPIFTIVAFAVLIAFAFANTRRPEWHKRLLLTATIAILQAAVARWIPVMRPAAVPGVRPPPPNVFDALQAGLAADVLLFIAIAYDWRTRGKPHPAYLIAGAFVLAEQFLQLQLSTTPFWAATGDWLLHLT